MGNSVHFDRNTNKFSGLDSSDIDNLKKLYGDVDVEGEFLKMARWLLASSAGKRRKGNLAFIHRWLRNAPRQPSLKTLSNSCILEPYLESYLEDLWTDTGVQTLLSRNMK